MICPVAAVPPVTPFTCHMTDWFDEPVTVGVKLCVAPARKLTAFGATVTLTAGGGGGAGGVGSPAELSDKACAVGLKKCRE